MSRDLERAAAMSHTDLSNAQLLATSYHTYLKYVPDWGKWADWRDTHWVLEKESPGIRAAKATAKLLFERALDMKRSADIDSKEEVGAYKKAMAWAMRSQEVARLTAMANLAKSDLLLEKMPEAFDAHPDLLNTPAGTIDLKAGTLRKHSPADLLTKITRVSPDTNASCPTWLRALETVQPDPEMRSFLQRWAGYCLTGHVTEQCLVFHTGGGRNGKSTINDVFLYILGDYGIKAARNVLFSRKGFDPHPTEIASFHGARFVLCGETNEDAVFDAGLMKDLTGGDRITARRMREDFWSFKPTHKLNMFGQHIPKCDTSDFGALRRFRIMPWTVQVTEIDTEIETKLRAEAPAILAWMLKGARQWYAEGLGLAGQVTEANARFAQDGDTIGRFMSECLIADENALLPSSVLRALADEWGWDHGEEITTKALAKRMVRTGYVPARIGSAQVRGWRGVRKI